MTPLRIAALTALAMTAFAGNSLLCRLALKDTSIDAATFTTLRMVSGALVLWLLVQARQSSSSGLTTGAGNWTSALALFAYAAAFSFAYISLTAATGALLLFGAVQVTMIADGLRRGERPRPLQAIGMVLAFAGLIGLMLPGWSAPPLTGALLMLGAGVAWGVYSLRGRGSGDATRVTAGNFIRTVPMALVLTLIMSAGMSMDRIGALYAVLSGAVASGLGYAIWYSALPSLQATTAATVQLSVPIIAAVGGIVLLGEALTLRLVVAGAAILGGIAMVVAVPRVPVGPGPSTVRRAGQ